MSRWAGEEEKLRGVDHPASPCRVTAQLCRGKLCSLRRAWGKHRLQPQKSPRDNPGCCLATLRVASGPAPPSSDGSACRPQSCPVFRRPCPPTRVCDLQLLPVVHHGDALSQPGALLRVGDQQQPFRKKAG